MNRYDWIAVGLCLYGVHLMIGGVLSIVTVALAPSFGTMFSAMGEFGGTEFPVPAKSMALIVAIAQSFLGSFLIYLSLKLGLSLSKSTINAKASY